MYTLFCFLNNVTKRKIPLNSKAIKIYLQCRTLLGLVLKRRLETFSVLSLTQGNKR